jgi:hypothetical protein
MQNFVKILKFKLNSQNQSTGVSTLAVAKIPFQQTNLCRLGNNDISK